MHPMDAHMTGKATENARKAHTVLEINDWILWDWDDPPHDGWHLPYAMFHRCGQQTDNANGHHGASKHYLYPSLDFVYHCDRCEEEAPTGIVCAYELMNWKNKGYGG
jgi:hypothetical protein